VPRAPQSVAAFADDVNLGAGDWLAGTVVGILTIVVSAQVFVNPLQNVP
jgi:hypothetical protein